jgi:hypothetical protein
MRKGNHFHRTTSLAAVAVEATMAMNT